MFTKMVWKSEIKKVMVMVLPLLLLCWEHNASVLCLLEFTREDFPSDFVFGAGTSAFQYEGAWAEDGKTPSIWDTFTHAGLVGESITDVASDGYHKYKGDITLMNDTGLEAYRLSISWPRLLPKGRGPVNPKGLEYYNNVIDELIKHGIQPHVTLHHLDIPQVLQDEYGGWLSRKFIDDFKELADVCFREFGDRVSYWTTMNEPNINAMSSFDYGYFPPNRCSFPFGDNCTRGNSTVEPYIAAHNMILAHSAVVELYRQKYQIMKKNCGSRLPSFTSFESQQVKGSYDFIGLNYYYALYATYDPNISMADLRDITLDMFAKFTDMKDGTPISRILPPSHPTKDFHSLWKLLYYLKNTYNNPPIYIHENGFGFGVVDTIDDLGRISFLSGFIGSVLDSIRDGSDVRGYFIWAFLDVYEWITGLTERFGLYHVNFEDTELERTPRLSAHWYRNFLKDGGTIKIEKICQQRATAQSSQ
ncbi:hypothetical protein KFK09_004954 [Dendrobium nobile]|uniref:Uncharacterized protein n=1 Tax=Dendrobium nobile TaxID=94219 RepID=A0A8T3BUD3_DENNO|nr:hypothetical protein KFK09_004954 [Dendrobium nobile]